jgi:hypothetical protein
VRVCLRQGVAADRTDREVGGWGVDEQPGRLYEWLRRVASQWGWSQARLAAEACGGINTNTMLHWKTKGARPGPRTLGAIALGVGVSVDQLHAVMRGEDVPIPSRTDQNNGPAVGSNEERIDRLERRTDLLMDLLLELRQGR